MKKISENVLIETDHFGVNLGAVVEDENVMFIDAPLLPEHTRLWRNAATKKKKLAMKLAILDSHPDRTIGSRFLECSIVAHDDVMHVYQSRPITFKPISQNSGSDWEKIEGMNGFRWAYPEIVFSRRMDFHQENLHIVMEFHPGASIGTTWVNIPEQKVLFIGDSVITDHAPFLGDADFNLWLHSLEELKSAAYTDYVIVSGRSGIITQKDIAPMEAFLRDAENKMESYAEGHEDDSAIDAVSSKLKPEKYFSIKKDLAADAAERLSYGFRHYFKHHYMKEELPEIQEDQVSEDGNEDESEAEA